MSETCISLHLAPAIEDDRQDIFWLLSLEHRQLTESAGDRQEVLRRIDHLLDELYSQNVILALEDSLTLQSA